VGALGDKSQELFHSPCTFEMHVSNILARLDCRSRAEAAHKSSAPGRLA
jgi:DNA-binding NarL/FixJ family response regulator